MSIRIGDLDLGKIDGKAEFSEARIGQPAFFDAFLIPNNVQLSDFEIGKKYFIQGFRGTGKTSLLRYFVFKHQPRSEYRRIILFKSEIDEDHRVSLSTQTGFEWVEVQPNSMEISQDFKSAWRWFVLHKVAELLKNDPTIAEDTPDVRSFLNLFGLTGETTVSKVLGVFPRIKSGKISISGDIGLLKGELETDFEAEKGNNVSLSLRAVVAAAERLLVRITFKDRVFLGFDELEAFYTDEDKFNRDLRMVRDLLFVVDQLNQKLREAASSLFMIAAVRSEVLHSMKALGQEVERSVFDHGTTLSWHHAARSLRHPLMDMIRKKLTACCVPKNGEEILFDLFPKKIDQEPLDKYLLDRSFYKPRDLIWRITIVQDQFPGASSITQEHLERTVGTYSQQMWAEVAYELSAIYNSNEVDAIKRMLSGFWRYFTFEQFHAHVERQAVYSQAVGEFISRRDLTELLHTLYRLGAIGNDYRYDRSGRKRVNRWIFRNEADLLIDKQMALNAALWRTLSTKTVHGRRA